MDPRPDLIDSAPAATPRLPAVDALRGIACLWVVALHSHELAPLGSRTTFNVVAGPLIDIGFLGVNLFLVISGFCLYYAVARRGQSQVNYRSFMAGRLRRIMPPHYAALAICLILGHFHLFERLHPPKHWWDPMLHLLLVNNLSSVAVISINPVFWTLALEWQLYLVFPFFLWLIRKGSFIALLGTTLAISRITQWLAMGPRWPHHPNLQPLLFSSLPSRCFEFACGMTAAHLVVARKVPRWTLSIVIAGAIWILVAYPGQYPAARQMKVNVFAVSGITFAALIALCAAHEGKLWEFGIGRALASIGMFSYSVYLIHYPVVLALAPLMKRWTPRAEIALLTAMAACVAVGWLFYLAVERHFMGRKHAGRSWFNLNYLAGSLATRVPTHGAATPRPPTRVASDPAK